MFRKMSKARFILTAIGFWLLLVGAYAVWGFVIPHDFTFGPEIGPLASFTYFVAIYTIPYAVVSLILFVLAFGGDTDSDT